MDASSMDASPMNAPAGVQEAEAHQSAEISRWWWAWLVTGILWIAAAIVILQFRQSSVVTVGIIIGVMFLAAGAQELVVAAVSGGWRWLWMAFGAIFVVGGVYALFNPVRTFVAVASLLGILLVLVGVFWVVEAFTTKAGNDLWWLGLIAGFVMIGLGFWADGQFFATQAYTLLIFAGIWALMHGVTDIIKAFAIKRLGAMVAV